MHLSLVLKAFCHDFGSLISLMSSEWTNRNAAHRHLELPGNCTRVTAGQTHRIRIESPSKRARIGLRQKTSRKGSLNQPRIRKSLRSGFFRPQFYVQKWPRRFYGHLGFFRSFYQENLHAQNFLVLGGDFAFFLRGGSGSANFIFTGVGFF